MQRSLLSALVLTVAAVGLQAQASIAYTLYGDSAGAGLGWTVDAVGDVNGDGISDFIVGEPLDVVGGVIQGSARLHSGADGSLIHAWHGAGVDDAFGCYVAGAGDVNADGFPDVIVGAYRDDDNGLTSGSASVYSGLDGALLYHFNGNDPGDHFGYCVAGAGDVDADGHADLIVGAFLDDDNGFQSGGVYVFSGADGSLLHDIAGASIDDQFGISVRGIGDVDQDGHDDFAVGAYRDDDNGLDSGSVTVYSGADGSILHHLVGDAPNDQFGFSVGAAGDVDGDGVPDLIVGARLDDTNGNNAGMARVFSGLDGSIIWTFRGDGAEDYFGAAVDGAGDLDGDGYADLIVGARFDDPNGIDSGMARVFSGRDGSVLASFDGDSADDLFGYEVSGAGDLDGDGFDDLLVGAPRDDDAGMNAGSLRAWLMPSLPALEYHTQTGAPHLLDLDWIPDGNDPQALTGTLRLTGATPGGLGLVAASRESTDYLLFGYLPILVDGDPNNVLLFDPIAFDGLGGLTAAGITRQNPYLAGQQVHIQFFETSPIVSSSTAVRLLATF
ncbi:MAG: FG-GAP repeat protein [Planctomycetes bacterium]|nr:FG-GAP repeat protein [Planctomycetota bacterium]